MRFSPDGKRLVTASSDGTVRIWDITPSKEILLIPFANPENSWNEWLSYNADGTRLLTNYTDSNARIWDANMGKELMQLSGHTTDTGAFQPSYSLDGKWIATAAKDGTARIWDASSGENLLTLPVDREGAGGVSFSPDGKGLAVGGYSGIYIFALPIEDVIALAKSRLTRTFTTEECQQYLHVATCPAEP